MNRERPKLNMKQRIEFLKMVAQLSTPVVFERRFGLSSNDIEFYKKQFNVESQSDARRLYKRLEIEQAEGREDMIISETSKARSAEETANQRLKELEQRRAAEQREKVVNTLDANLFHADDAIRQRRFEDEQNTKVAEALSKGEAWELPLTGTQVEKRATIERFRKDIVYNGITFCLNKYHVTSLQIKAEATKLGLRINWDSVKR